MNALTAWRTDDLCPVCGTALTATDDEAGNQVRQDCPLCGWSTTWDTTLSGGDR
jgi:hypothetical protein